MKLDVLKAAVPMWASMPVRTACALRHGGLELLAGEDSHAVDADAARRELLTRSKDGEHIELELVCTPFLQYPERSNRNFTRFRPSALRSLGKSGVGSVFLRDHRQHDLTARGGTVTASQMEKGEAGIYRLVQVIRLHEPWAVQMALTGSIDRFSIGWWPTGPISCSVCGTEILDKCWHWPGDKVEDKAGPHIVEWVFHAAELIETSAVGIPAVTGTTVEDIRAALAAHAPRSVDIEPTRRYSMQYERIAPLLGLSATDGEDSVVAAVTELKRRVDDADNRIAALSAQLEDASKALADERAARQTLEAQIGQEAEERFITGGVEAGKIRPGSKFEQALRNMYQADREAAEEMLASAPVVTPIGAPRQSDKPAPAETSIDEVTYQQLKAAGIDDPAAYFAKYGSCSH